MKLAISIQQVQHINRFDFELDLENPGIVCLTGKNSTGKTTLIKAFMNLYQSDTFIKTSSPYIFSKKSRITISIGNDSFLFTYNEKLSTIDTRQKIPRTIKDLFFAELPMPYGVRFRHFQKLSDIDGSLRSKISLSEYTRPSELIEFLSRIYGTNRFENLKSVEIKGEEYYFILLKDNYYIREDYLSSGEYFVINLFRSIKKNKKIMFIDEIDISLDASAQVNLIRELRSLCLENGINMVFTTHSLPLMKTLNSDELFYIHRDEGRTLTTLRSYNFVKTVLFGFSGWDKYILTEDTMLEKYIDHCLKKLEHPPFMKYKIIPIGGADQIIEIMERNINDNFLSQSKNVICILDGDQKGKHDQHSDKNIHVIPFESIEKEILDHYESDRLNIGKFSLSATKRSNKAKELFRQIIKTKKMTITEVFEYLDSTKQADATELQETLSGFLNI